MAMGMDGDGVGKRRSRRVAIEPQPLCGSGHNSPTGEVAQPIAMGKANKRKAPEAAASPQPQPRLVAAKKTKVVVKQEKTDAESGLGPLPPGLKNDAGTAIDVDKKVSALTLLNLAKAMSELPAADKFLPGRPEVTERTQNFDIQDRAAAYQASALRLRRPMSRPMSALVDDMWCKLWAAGMIQLERLVPVDKKGDWNLALVEEVVEMYNYADMDAPESIQQYLQEKQAEFFQDKKYQKALKTERYNYAAALEVDFVAGTTLDGVSLFPLGSSGHFKLLEERAQALYGAGLSQLLAPVMYLHNTREKPIEAVRAELGLLAEGDVVPEGFLPAGLIPASMAPKAAPAPVAPPVPAPVALSTPAPLPAPAAVQPPVGLPLPAQGLPLAQRQPMLPPPMGHMVTPGGGGVYGGMQGPLPDARGYYGQWLRQPGPPYQFPPRTPPPYYPPPGFPPYGP